jgi:hypothetical protein
LHELHTPLSYSYVRFTQSDAQLSSILQGHHTHHTPNAQAHKNAGDRAHAHAHPHAPATYDRAFAIGIALNVSYALIEAVAG